MSKREELESKRDQLDKEVSKDNGLNTLSLYERSVLVGKLIRLFGTMTLILCVGYAIYYFIFVESAIVFRVITSICFILSGFISKVIIEWFSLVLLNLAELNNK
jgi:hypothetical protein